MEPRSWSGANGTFWSIRKGYSWQSMSIRPTSWIGMASSGCSMNPHEPSCHACAICGWIRATTAGAKAATGSRRWWAGRSMCCVRSIDSNATPVPNDIPPDQIDWSHYLPAPGFHVLTRRWVVERTFAWLLFNRRLSRDYERLCATSETWIYLAMSRLMLRRLARMQEQPTRPSS